MRIKHSQHCGREQWTIHLPEVRDYISDETFAIQRCNSCGLCVTDPMPGDDVIERYYPQRYRGDRQKYSGGWRVRRRAAAVQNHFTPTFRGRLLDLGCGTGAFAMAMKQRAWDTAVTEINDAVLTDLRAVGMEAKRPDEALRDGFSAPFDAITCWHVLEHVEHPYELAKWARQQLKPGGIFQVTVPNLASWQARMFDKDWLHLDVPRHRYHFSPDTLKKLLNDAGFEIVHSTTFALEYDLFGWLQSALNRVCTRPNVLFEKLTAKTDARPMLLQRDVMLSYALSPLLATWVVPICFVSWPLRRGATAVTCKPK